MLLLVNRAKDTSDLSICSCSSSSPWLIIAFWPSTLSQGAGHMTQRYGTNPQRRNFIWHKSLEQMNGQNIESLQSKPQADLAQQWKYIGAIRNLTAWKSLNLWPQQELRVLEMWWYDYQVLVHMEPDSKRNGHDRAFEMISYVYTVLVHIEPDSMEGMVVICVVLQNWHITATTGKHTWESVRVVQPRLTGGPAHPLPTKSACSLFKIFKARSCVFALAQLKGLQNFIRPW